MLATLPFRQTGHPSLPSDLESPGICRPTLVKGSPNGIFVEIKQGAVPTY